MLTQREMDVLEILWKAGEPQIGADIAGFDPKLGLTQSTVTAVLRTLLNRGLVEVAEIRKSGKVLSRAFSPTRQAKEEVLDTFAEMYNAVKSGVYGERGNRQTAGVQIERFEVICVWQQRD